MSATIQKLLNPEALTCWWWGWGHRGWGRGLHLSASSASGRTPSGCRAASRRKAVSGEASSAGCCAGLCGLDVVTACSPCSIGHGREGCLAAHCSSIGSGRHSYGEEHVRFHTVSRRHIGILPSLTQAELVYCRSHCATVEW